MQLKAKNILLESLPSYHDELQAELKQLINGDVPLLYNMLRYHLGWQDKHGHPYQGNSGKFVRSTLCLLSCQAVGGNVSQVLPAAAALEIVHSFSLIHDDIEDAGSERHHRPTVWKIWGQAQAINAGDTMFALAYLALFKLEDRGITEKKVLHSGRMLAKACLSICEGQSLDISYENRHDVGIRDYLSMIEKKTASLIALSTSLGAYLGTAEERIVNLMYEFGKKLGMAYQIRDDMLDIWGKEDKLGKAVRSDILQGKKTLPVIYAVEKSQGGDKERLDEFYSAKSIRAKDVAGVIEVLDHLGAKDYAQNLAEQYYQQALAELETTGLELSYQAPLKEMACFLVKRDY